MKQISLFKRAMYITSFLLILSWSETSRGADTIIPLGSKGVLVMELPDEFLPPAEAPQGPAPVDPQAEERHPKRELARYLCETYGVHLKAASVVVEAIDREIAQYEGISFGRILAMMHSESSFDPSVRSRKGAIGLLQITPGTGKFIAEERGETWKGSGSLRDMETNVRYGVWYYNYLRERYGSDKAALAAYNWGPGALDERLASNKAIPAKYPGKIFRVERRLKQELPDGVEEYVWGSNG